MFAIGFVPKTKGETPKETNLCFTESPQLLLDREHTYKILKYFAEHNMPVFNFGNLAQACLFSNYKNRAPKPLSVPRAC
jgi:aryl-alcohol dehydrogenase-like predicted oxidoreductase